MVVWVELCMEFEHYFNLVDIIFAIITMIIVVTYYTIVLTVSNSDWLPEGDYRCVWYNSQVDYERCFTAVSEITRLNILVSGCTTFDFFTYLAHFACIFY